MEKHQWESQTIQIGFMYDIQDGTSPCLNDGMHVMCLPVETHAIMQAS